MTLDNYKNYAIYLPPYIDKVLAMNSIKNLVEKSASDLRITNGNSNILNDLPFEWAEGILITIDDYGIGLLWIRDGTYHDGHLERLYGDVIHLDINLIMGVSMVAKKPLKHTFV